jgi:hypothetical protein
MGLEKIIVHGRYGINETGQIEAAESDVFIEPLAASASKNGRMHNEEHHNFYASPNIVRVIKSRKIIWAGHVARMGEIRNIYKMLVGKPEMNTPLVRPRSRWEDNFRRDLREMSWEGVDWIHLTQDRDQG